MVSLPRIIQGGMGVGVSNWRLARAVSSSGQLGVVSGTALDRVFVRRLADGDQGGHTRRALEAFPFPKMAKRLWNEYFVPGGKAGGASYPAIPMHQLPEPRKLIELCLAANFTEVFLAREGHGNPVGINFLEKVQLPHLASILGAMLAGVEYVLMGAGIPLHIPGVLDALALHQAAEYKLSVTGAAAGQAQDWTMRLVPAEYAEGPLPPLVRPRFVAIVSSHTLAATLLRRANGTVDGFVVEGPTAGGHNAPPRGKLQLNEEGEPMYGERDRVDAAGFRDLGVPFWLAGGFASRARLEEALSEGAAGVQVGTAFAFCRESGLREDLKSRLLTQAKAGTARVFTDPLASPTGFPFKVAQVEGSLSEAGTYAARTRVCDVGLLREAYQREDGRIGYRCPAEPADSYTVKGGLVEATQGRKCLCNALLANIGLAQTRANGTTEAPLVTLGDDLNIVRRFLPAGESSYGAADVIQAILGQREEATPAEEGIEIQYSAR